MGFALMTRLLVTSRELKSHQDYTTVAEGGRYKPFWLQMRMCEHHFGGVLELLYALIICLSYCWVARQGTGVKKGSPGWFALLVSAPWEGRRENMLHDKVKHETFTSQLVQCILTPAKTLQMDHCLLVWHKHQFRDCHGNSQNLQGIFFFKESRGRLSSKALYHLHLPPHSFSTCLVKQSSQIHQECPRRYSQGHKSSTTSLNIQH